MRVAIEEAERARTTTGDNPWVGCLIVDARGEVVARGHTQGPGEDHAEIAALRSATARGIDVAGATLYSTLEPCSFHARTPACSRVIIDYRLARVVIGMRDPHPRVDGEGARILRAAGIDVLEGVCEREVRRQLGSWVFTYHPREPLRRALALAARHERAQLALELSRVYAVELSRAERLAQQVLDGSLVREHARTPGTMTIYDFSAKDIEGNERPLADFKGKALLVVNVASRCGMTPHYEGLEAMYQELRDRGFEVLGFPCNQFGAQEPGSEADIKEFCSTRYNIDFPMFAKVDVNGEARHPLFAWLTEQGTQPDTPGDIRWNFTKFVIDRNGEVVARFSPPTSPADPELRAAVEKALG
jgi:glutathione peroxidase-family protein/pyrimidine deaminase RibD-like protein